MSNRININYDIKSLEKAIERIEIIKKKFQTTIPTIFLDRCLDYVIKQANQYLDGFDIDKLVTSDIQNHWRKEKLSNNRVRLLNDSDKAVYIEFGVGKVGQSKSHPNSSKTGYEYNIPTDAKTLSGQWVFKLDDKQGVDLVAGYYKQRKDNIITKGSPANMYLYNAMMDLISSGSYKTIWNRVLQEQL